MNGPFISRRWPKSVVQEIQQPEIIDPLELPQAPQAQHGLQEAPQASFQQPTHVQDAQLPHLPPPQIPDIREENPPQNRNAFTAIYRRFFPSGNPVTLNEIEMQRLLPSPPPQIFHPPPQPQSQQQPQVQSQPQVLSQPPVQDQSKSETLYGPQAFLDDDIYIEGTIHDYIISAYINNRN